MSIKYTESYTYSIRLQQPPDMPPEPTLEDAFDAFAERAVLRGRLSHAALDGFTDFLAGCKDEERRVRAMGLLLKRFLKPGNAVQLEQYPDHVPPVGDLNGIVGVVLGDECYSPWVPRSYTVLFEPEDGDAAMQLKVKPCYLRPPSQEEQPAGYDSPVDEALPEEELDTMKPS